MSFSLWSRRLYGSSSSLPLVPQMISSRLFRSSSHSGRLGSPRRAVGNTGTLSAPTGRISWRSSASCNRSSNEMSSRVFTTVARPRTVTSFSIAPALFRKTTPFPTGVLSSLSQFSTDDGPGGRRSPYTQVNPPPASRRWAQGVGLLGAASVLFGKTKYLLAALKVTKLASLGSMVLSVGAYSMIFGWPYAVGMVGLIFCHECGHLAVMLQRGIPFSPMVFIPFMGAVISMKDQPRDAWEDAVVAAGGPIAGTAASMVVALAAQSTNAQVLYALADFGYMINLINLLPIGSMDGGRWVGALSKYVGVVGTGIGGYLAWNGMIGNPLFYLIWLAGAYETFQRFYNPHFLPPNFYKISTMQRAILTGGYFGLVAVLLAAMSLNRQRQKPPEMLLREHGREPFWDSSSFE